MHVGSNEAWSLTRAPARTTHRSNTMSIKSIAIKGGAVVAVAAGIFAAPPAVAYEPAADEVARAINATQSVKETPEPDSTEGTWYRVGPFIVTQFA